MNRLEIIALKRVLEFMKDEERDIEEVSTGHISYCVRQLNNYLDDLHVRVVFNAGCGFLIGLILARILSIY